MMTIALRFAACIGIWAIVSCTDADIDGDGDGDEIESFATAEASLHLTGSPEVPAVVRDVSIVRNGQLRSPTIPAHRTSNDGRIAIEMKDWPKRFYLFAPERLTSHFWDSGPGISVLASNTPVELRQPLHNMPNGNIVHTTLCDGTPQFNIPATFRTQPYACASNRDNDCYDLTVLASVSNGAHQTQLWSTPIQVVVTNPKTASASFTVRATGAPVGGSIFPADLLFEPMVTRDGHLLVARTENTFIEPATREVIDIVYSMHNAGVAACDVRGWTRLDAITRAPEDPRVNPRYGFARQRFRDTEGQLIAAGRDLQATYPWIDRDGRNLFFTIVDASLYQSTSSRYPTRCPAGVAGCTGGNAAGYAIEQRGPTRGPTVMGLWTHGRMVLLDGRINHLDYGLGVRDDWQREIQLYTDDSRPVWIRAGTGRDTTDTGMPNGVPTNTTFIDSLENIFNSQRHMHPRSPRDVVWLVNSQLTTEEIIFDDWLNPQAVIVSDMVPSWTHSANFRDGTYNDGYHPINGFNSTRQLRMQNAATAPSNIRNVPRFGAVSGPSRAEPVGLGGIFGKGLWFTPTTRLQYEIPRQPTPVAGDPWFVSLFLDARILNNDGVDRRILNFPDGTSVVLRGQRTLRFLASNDTQLATVPLPAQLAFGPRGYRHLGLRMTNNGRRIEVLLDGFVLQTTIPSAPLGRFPQGPFVVGKKTASDSMRGINGWVDELRVFAEAVQPEVACNHARGTLVGLSAAAPAQWRNRAALSPAAEHTKISDQLQAHRQGTFSTYACVHDYVNEHAVGLDNLPPGTTSVRSALLFPEGPLHFNQPRPDSSRNPFCLSCHSPRLPASLSLLALMPDSTRTMAHDGRRQPMQPPRLTFGTIPAGFFRPGVPTVNQYDPGQGTPIDRWVFP